MKEYKYFAMLTKSNRVVGLYMAVTAPEPKSNKHFVIEVTETTYCRLLGF